MLEHSHVQQELVKMKKKILFSLLAVLLVVSIVTAGVLNNVATTQISKTCYQILQSKGIGVNDLKLIYLFEKNGNDYFAVRGKGLSKSFYIDASLTDAQKETEINQLKVEKIEEWCLEQNKKYDDVNLNIISK